MISFLSSQGAVTRSVMVAHVEHIERQTTPRTVSSQADTAIRSGEPLTDESREEAIKRAGDLMEKRYADFARSGDFADLGDAHHALLVMKRLIAGRRPEMVRLLEIRKGLI